MYAFSSGGGRCHLHGARKMTLQMSCRMLAACEEMRRGGWWEPPAINVKKAVGLEFAVAIVKSLFGF